MKRNPWMALLLLAGCGANPAPMDPGPSDTGAEAAADVPQDMLVADTGAPMDTAAMPDTAIADTTAPDTAAPDTTAVDTARADTAAADTAMADATRPDTTTEDGGVLPYPPGPYGNREGQILADLRLDGYVNLAADRVSTELPFVQTSMAALRGRGRGYGLVHLSEVF
ncbi:MAG: hypothetical protein HY909_09910 [Deltaproteobacteria bacterium]|nr:hypothetical protein [Deltaproteobacteria bacterium]